MLTSSGDHMVHVRCCLWVKKGHLTSADRPEECQLQLRLRPETFAMSFSPRRVWNIITHADIVKLAIKSLGVPLNRNVIRTFLLLFFARRWCCNFKSCHWFVQNKNPCKMRIHFRQSKNLLIHLQLSPVYQMITSRIWYIH